MVLPRFNKVQLPLHNLSKRCCFKYNSISSL